MWAPKLRTPGIVRSSLLACDRDPRFISGQEVLGSVTQCIRKSRSLNDGSSECPSNGQIARCRPRMTTATRAVHWHAAHG